MLVWYTLLVRFYCVTFEPRSQALSRYVKYRETLLV